MECTKKLLMSLIVLGICLFSGINCGGVQSLLYLERGLAKYNAQRYREAIAEYNQAIKLNPAYALAYSNRGFAKASLGDYVSAIADYDRAIQLKPDLILAYSNRGFSKGITW